MEDKRLEHIIDIIRSMNLREEMGVAAMGGPTNNVGDGKISGVVPGEDPPVRKKKKRYIYGGSGSRKMWLQK